MRNTRLQGRYIRQNLRDHEQGLTIVRDRPPSAETEDRGSWAVTAGAAAAGTDGPYKGGTARAFDNAPVEGLEAADAAVNAVAAAAEDRPLRTTTAGIDALEESGTAAGVAANVVAAAAEDGPSRAAAARLDALQEGSTARGFLHGTSDGLQNPNVFGAAAAVAAAAAKAEVRASSATPVGSTTAGFGASEERTTPG